MIDRGDIRQAIDRLQQYLGFTAGRWLWSVRAQGRQPDCKNSKKRAERSGDWCMSRVTKRDYLRLLSASSSARRGLNHYRDNAITTKPSATKCYRELKLANAVNYWHADASAWCCCADAKYTKELADAKAEMMLCVMSAAGRRHRSRSLSVSAQATAFASGVDNAALPRLADNCRTGLFHPQREADHYAKTNRKEPRSILMSSR